MRTCVVPAALPSLTAPHLTRDVTDSIHHQLAGASLAASASLAYLCCAVAPGSKGYCMQTPRYKEYSAGAWRALRATSGSHSTRSAARCRLSPACGGPSCRGTAVMGRTAAVRAPGSANIRARARRIRSAAGEGCSSLKGFPDAVFVLAPASGAKRYFMKTSVNLYSNQTPICMQKQSNQTKSSSAHSHNERHRYTT